MWIGMCWYVYVCLCLFKSEIMYAYVLYVVCVCVSCTGHVSVVARYSDDITLSPCDACYSHSYRDSQIDDDKMITKKFSTICIEKAQQNWPAKYWLPLTTTSTLYTSPGALVAVSMPTAQTLVERISQPSSRPTYRNM